MALATSPPNVLPLPNYYKIRTCTYGTLLIQWQFKMSTGIKTERILKSKGALGSQILYPH